MTINEISALSVAVFGFVGMSAVLWWFFWRINKDAQEAFAEQNAAKTH